MSSIKALVLAGDGINCERESKAAFEMVGAWADIVHINDLLANKTKLDQYQIMCIPGGFSFGDELGSGQILAHKIHHGLEQEFYRFVENKRPIIGICNGFQVLTKLGLLPDYKGERLVALNHNINQRFIDCWSELNVPENTICQWTKGMDKFPLPIRHGEGRVCFPEGKEQQVFDSLYNNGQIALQYCQNPNGSYRDIAGICDKEGLILGLMPHPEAAVSRFSHIKGEGLEENNGPGLKLFQNIMEIF